MIAILAAVPGTGTAAVSARRDKQRKDDVDTKVHGIGIRKVTI
jgi:hypothetical protein